MSYHVMTFQGFPVATGHGPRLPATGGRWKASGNQKLHLIRGVLVDHPLDKHVVWQQQMMLCKLCHIYMYLLLLSTQYMYVSTQCFKSIIYNITVLNSVLSSVFYIEGLHRTSIHAQNNQSMLHALWPRRHCATAPSKDTFHGIFAILLFLPQASIHIQSFELHGIKTIPPPKKNEHQSVSPQQSCLMDSLIFFGKLDALNANNFPQLHLGPQRLLLHLLRVFASVETRCEFIKTWGSRHGSHTYPYHPCDWNIYLHLP